MIKKSAFSRRALALCLAFASLSASAGESCTASQLELPVEMVGKRAVVNVAINGTPVRLLVDSGAFFSFLSPAVANQLQLKLGELPVGAEIEGVTGEMRAQLATVEHLRFQGGEIPNVQFIVGGNESSGFQGLLGRNLLTNGDIEFDFANGMIRLFFPHGECSEASFAYWAGDKPYAVLPLLREDSKKRNNKRPPTRAFATINGQRIEVMFDTGASTSVLASSAARRAGVSQDQMTPQGLIYGIGSGSLASWEAKFNSFSLAEERIENVRLRVADMELPEAEMLIGADFFLAHRVYVSKLQHRMYFTHNGGPVFAPDVPATAQPGPIAPPAGAAPGIGASGEPALDADAYARRGAGSASRHDYAAALADLDRAISLAPGRPDYLVRRGAVHLALRQSPEARKDFDTALHLDPKNSEALLHRAAMQLSRSGHDAALADLKTLDTTLPTQAQERLLMARLYERFDEPLDALTQLTHWVATRDDDITLANVLSWRCALRARLGIELDAALADCNRAIAQDDKNADYLENRGLLRLKRGEPDKALPDFDQALARRPESPWALYGRAVVRRLRGQTAASRADLEAARTLRPQVDAQLVKFGLPSPG